MSLCAGFINLPSICKKLKTKRQGNTREDGGRKLFLFLFLYIIKMWIYNVVVLGFLPVEKFPYLMKGENNFSVRFSAC